MSRASTAILIWLFSVVAAQGVTLDVSRGSEVSSIPCGTQVGSLRQRIAEANATPELDEILVAPLSIQLLETCGELQITAPVIIRACSANGCPTLDDCDDVDAAATVIIGANERIFRVRESAASIEGVPPLQLCGLTLRRGDASAEASCRPSAVPEKGGGGAICNESAVPVVVRDVVLDQNKADFGGAIWGPVWLLGATLQGNSASIDGGAAWIGAGSLQVDGSTISGNTAAGSGGGVWASREAGTATDARLEVAVAGSTLSANTATSGDGGGLYLGDVSTTTVENATFSGNQATAGAGGGLFLLGGSQAASLRHLTVAKNKATVGAGVRVDTRTGGSAPVVVNSLLVENDPSQCVGTFGTGSVANLVSDDTTSSAECTASSVLDTDGGRYTAAEVQYGALAVGTGPTATHALEEESPALRRGDAAACTCRDQRGELRGPEPATCEALQDSSFPSLGQDPATLPCRNPGAGCDIGAVERRLDCDGGGDGVPDYRDNCRHQRNGDQGDADGDFIGDACDCARDVATPGGEDADPDGDHIANVDDCCPASVAPDGHGLYASKKGCTVEQLCACDMSLEIDGGTATRLPWCSANEWRRCVRNKTRSIVPRREQKRYAADLVERAMAQGGECPDLAPSQGDRDCDGVADAADNCRRTKNSKQKNCDDDARGDRCDRDVDGDGLPNDEDRCPTIASPMKNVQHKDADSDGLGNECDCCPFEASEVHADVDARGCEEGQKPRDPETLPGCSERRFDPGSVCEPAE